MQASISNHAQDAWSIKYFSLMLYQFYYIYFIHNHMYVMNIF